MTLISAFCLLLITAGSWLCNKFAINSSNNLSFAGKTTPPPLSRQCTNNLKKRLLPLRRPLGAARSGGVRPSPPAPVALEPPNEHAPGGPRPRPRPRPALAPAPPRARAPRHAGTPGSWCPRLVAAQEAAVFRLIVAD